MSKLSDGIRKAGIGSGERKGPLWKGPEVDGITFSLLSRFLVCRERFRLYAIEGLQPAPSFNHRIEYGSMWHVCEEALASGKSPANTVDQWVPLQRYADFLCAKYPTAVDQIQHWYNVCRTQFPVYVDYWSRHPDVKARTPLLQEVAFSVPYKLPSGRTVRLRGKWDSVDLIGSGIYLQENKTKGDIKESLIARQLTFDLQTMLYLVALDRWQEDGINSGNFTNDYPELYYKIRGVRYNVIRRPLSGGKGSIVQHKPTSKCPNGESAESFYSRLGDIIKEDPGYFFMRWQVEVGQADILKFRHQCLDPILEQLCDWWEQVSTDAFIKEPHLADWSKIGHWRHPFGIYNVLDEGGASDVDSYLDTGSTVGLHRATTLFPELE